MTDESWSPSVADGGPRDGRLFALTVIVPFLVAVASGMRFSVANEVTIGLLVALALSPVWVAHLSRYRGLLQIMTIGLLAIASGIVLTALDDTRATGIDTTLRVSLQFLTILVTMGTLAWVRLSIGSHAAAAAYGAGWLVSAVLNHGLSESNPWKMAFSAPVAILLLALAARSGRRYLEILALGLLAVVSLSADSRSLTAMLALTMVVMIWQTWVAREPGRRPRPLIVILGLATTSFAIYQLIQAVVLEGALGEAAKDRSVQQIDASGSLVTGGRPEMGAAMALIRDQPWGYGSGVMPSASDVWTAKSGMYALNYDPNNGYVTGYLFGSGFEVHSVLGDLWLRFGVFGAIFAVVVAGYCLYSAASRVSTRTASALLILLTAQAMWDLLFSPLRSASYTLVLALPLAALPTRVGRMRRSDPRTRS